MFSLAGGVSVGDLALAEELIGGSCKGLVVDDTIAVVQVGIPEFTDGLGVDRLGISVLGTLDSDNLGNSGVGGLRMVDQSRCRGSGELLANAGFNSTIDLLRCGFVAGLSEGLSVDVL